MRHTVHIMLGDNTEQVLCNIREYIIKYGDKDSANFFYAMLYDDKQDNGAVFYKAVPSHYDADSFVAGIDNLYSVGLKEDYVVASDNRPEFLKSFFAKLYDERITINNPGDDDSLLLCFYLPTYHAKYCSVLHEFVDAIDAIPQKYTVDVFLLSHELAYLFEDDLESLPLKMAGYQEQTKKTINYILEYNKTRNSISHAIILQNCNSSGVSLDLTQESLVRIVGEYALLSLKHYKDIYNPNLQDRERSIHALGLSVLSFDKYYFVQYLLHKAYINILDRENILQEEVDVNKVSPIVQRILEDNVNVFTSFYNKSVRDRLDMGKKQDDIVPVIYEELQREIARLTDEFQKFLEDDTLSLPEKKAVLAQLLGEDDELFVGYLFDKRQLVLDDCARGMLDFFIEYNNKLAALHSTSSATDSEQPEREIIAEHAALSRDSKESVPLASDLLDELKSIKVKMRSSSNYVRQKEEELHSIGAHIKGSVESQKRLTQKGFVFEGRTYRLQSDIEERPCSEDYKPTKLNLPASVDLRRNFTPVKDQGEVGACSAFSIVGIFEYILKKNGQHDADLSESFVYYNARKDKHEENVDDGSSLIGVIESIMKQGVCHEKLWPYSKPFDECPSEEAYDDAQSNKIVKALNVKRELNDLKSALAEGHPIAISLKIYDSFKTNEGFVSRPSQEEIDGEEHGNHAMILCGYSDDAKVFVVRNSWGVKFGDCGYCFIPYSYISDASLLNVACIVTEIADSKLKVGGKVDTTKSLFGDATSKIKAAIIRNLIGEERFLLSKLREKFEAKTKQFTMLAETIGNNSIRETIEEGTKLRLEMECRNLSNEKTRKQQERIEELDGFDKRTRVNKWCYGILSALIVLIYVSIFIHRGTLSAIPEVMTHECSYWMYGVYFVVTVIFVLWCRQRKSKRRTIEEDYEIQLNQLASDIAKREKENDVLHIKTYVAGIWVDSFYKLSRDLHSKYLGMKSYVGNLKVWRTEEEKIVNIAPMNRDPFLSLISNECLDNYFETQKDNITQDIKMSAMFKDRYGIEEKQIVAFKNGLKEKLVKSLFSLVEDFSIFKHVVKEATYPYLDDKYTELNLLLRQMDAKSEVFVRKASSAMIDDSTIKLLFLSTSIQEQRTRWDSIVGGNFTQSPSICMGTALDKITLLRVVGLKPEEVALME